MVRAEGGREQEGGSGSYAFLYLLLVTREILVGSSLQVAIRSLRTNSKSDLREH